MGKSLNLRQRIYLMLGAVLLLNLAGGALTLWHAHRTRVLFRTITETNLKAFLAAEALEIALVNQKGFVTYYFMDKDPNWLRQLGEYRQIFKDRMEEARQYAQDPGQIRALKEIEIQYKQYIAGKDRVIDDYKAGRHKEGLRLHKEVRDRFFKILELTEAYKDIHTRRIRYARQNAEQEADRLRIGVIFGVLFSLGLMGFLLFFLVGRILQPVSRLAAETDRDPLRTGSEDEITALSRSVRLLMEDMDHTSLELEKSRENLLQAEKLALVGKLAAGMAHSIRNPFTSVKMRLFSLSRSLKMTPTQQEDFSVISEEIRHIDNVVQNFLEFSRPPKLKMQRISPSQVVDQTLQLLSHRLKAYDVSVSVVRSAMLPEVIADPEQLKEVLVNLIINACEAMGGHGDITIRETARASEADRPSVALVISDNGPGIAEHLTGRVFQPFFTTKEEGTGLGLSIVERIVSQHGGKVFVANAPDKGAVFTIWLPHDE